MTALRIKGAVIALVVLGAAALVVVEALTLEGLLADSVRLVVYLGFIGLLLWATFAYWRALDEAAKEAHKFAWYWGGSFGLFFAGVLTSLLIQQPDLPERIIGPGQAAGDYALFGLTVVLGLQVVGYVVTWLGWWLWKGR